MKPLLITSSRYRLALGVVALMFALMAEPSAHAADRFAVRASLSPNPVQQISGSFTLNARLARAPTEKTEHLGSTFSLTGTLSPFAMLACYGDTIFRDGFDYQ